MGFMALGGEIQGSENAPSWMDWERSDFPSLTGTENTNWETATLQMSATEDSIRKETCGFNTTVECCANRFHTYRKCPNKRDPDVDKWANQSIQEYAQRTSMVGGSRGDKDIQGQRGHIS